jgi:hydrogenase nickel incorporation protein HypA/HybF
MHELSLCGAIIDTVAEHAQGRPVRRVNLRIGHFRQVVPATLQHCWRMRTGGTGFEGCELAVEHIAAVVACRACDQRTTLDRPAARCGACRSVDVDLVAGDEFLIESIDLGDAEHAPVTDRERTA